MEESIKYCQKDNVIEYFFPRKMSTQHTDNSLLETDYLQLVHLSKLPIHL